MKRPALTRLLQYIYRHDRLAATCEWLHEYWPMVVAFTLATAVILCLINLTVVVLSD